jgi:hypothetical protein
MSNSKIYVQTDGLKLRPNPEFLRAMPAFERRAWAANLTSGKYKQGVDYLYDESDRTFCCLGVKMHGSKVPLHELEGVALPDVIRHPRARNFSERFEADPVIAHANTGAIYCATECNDVLRLTFKQIAKLIYPEKYGYVLAD